MEEILNLNIIFDAFKDEIGYNELDKDQQMILKTCFYAGFSASLHCTEILMTHPKFFFESTIKKLQEQCDRYFSTD